MPDSEGNRHADSVIKDNSKLLRASEQMTDQENRISGWIAADLAKLILYTS